GDTAGAAAGAALGVVRVGPGRSRARGGGCCWGGSSALHAPATAPHAPPAPPAPPPLVLRRAGRDPAAAGGGAHRAGRVAPAADPRQPPADGRQLPPGAGRHRGPRVPV